MCRCLCLGQRGKMLVEIGGLSRSLCTIIFIIVYSVPRASCAVDLVGATASHGRLVPQVVGICVIFAEGTLSGCDKTLRAARTGREMLVGALLGFCEADSVSGLRMSMFLSGPGRYLWRAQTLS